MTAQAALTILQGLADNPVSDNLADNFIKWLADLSEDTIDTDDNMKEVRVYPYFLDTGRHCKTQRKQELAENK